MKLNLDGNKKYLLACSYGPDSMALFSMLQSQNFYFEVAHVNYHKRKESDSEANNLAAFCRLNHIPFHLKNVEPSSVKGNFQAWARDVRYNFFKMVCKERELDEVLTAHHLDDVLETYLMQKKAGRELMYYGIRECVNLNGVTVRRPLLNYHKDNLLNHCKITNTPYAIDASNLTLTYTRNVIRHQILGQMSKEDKAQLRSDIERYNQEQETRNQQLNKLITVQGCVERNAFIKLEKPSRKRIIYLLFALYNQEYVFTAGLFNQIEQTIVSKKTTAMFKVKNHLYLSLAYDQFCLIDIRDFVSYSVEIKMGKRLIKLKHIELDLSGDLSRFNIKQSSYPLTIRTARSGDMYQVGTYAKKVSRLFIDMKMPKHVRLIWPLIVDVDGTIIYIPRYRADFKKEDGAKLSVLW